MGKRESRQRISVGSLHEEQEDMANKRKVLVSTGNQEIKSNILAKFINVNRPSIGKGVAQYKS